MPRHRRRKAGVGKAGAAGGYAAASVMVGVAMQPVRGTADPRLLPIVRALARQAARDYVRAWLDETIGPAPDNHPEEDSR